MHKIHPKAPMIVTILPRNSENRRKKEGAKGVQRSPIGMLAMLRFVGMCDKMKCHFGLMPFEG